MNANKIPLDIVRTISSYEDYTPLSRGISALGSIYHKEKSDWHMRLRFFPDERMEEVGFVTDFQDCTITENDMLESSTIKKDITLSFPVYTTFRVPICTALNFAIDYFRRQSKPYSKIWSDTHAQTQLLLSLFDYICERKITLDSNFLDYALKPFDSLPKERMLEIVGHKSANTMNTNDYYNFLDQRENQLISLSKSLSNCYKVIDICFITLEALSLYKLPLLKCELCGKYFVPKSRSSEKYCDFFNKTYPDKTCKSAAKTISTLKKAHNDRVTALHKTIYNRLRNRAKKDKHRAIMFDSYMKQRDSFISAIQSGEKTEAEFLNWLETTEKRTRKED